jgi:hypothetical protein
MHGELLFELHVHLQRHEHVHADDGHQQHRDVRRRKRLQHLARRGLDAELYREQHVRDRVPRRWLHRGLPRKRGVLCRMRRHHRVPYRVQRQGLAGLRRRHDLRRSVRRHEHGRRRQRQAVAQPATRAADFVTRRVDDTNVLDFQGECRVA